MERSESACGSQDLGLLLIRVMVGLVFVYHGAQKLFGAFGGPGISGFAGHLEKMGFMAPLVSAWLAALAEFIGGLALISGWHMRLASLPLIFTMLVASFKVHGGAFGLQNNGMEYALTLAVVLLGLLFTGPGRFAFLSSAEMCPVKKAGGSCLAGG